MNSRPIWEMHCIGPFTYQEFYYRSKRCSVSKYEFEMLLKVLKERARTALVMRECNVNVPPPIYVLEKTRK